MRRPVEFTTAMAWRDRFEDGTERLRTVGIGAHGVREAGAYWRPTRRRRLRRRFSLGFS